MAAGQRGKGGLFDPEGTGSEGKGSPLARRFPDEQEPEARQRPLPYDARFLPVSQYLLEPAFGVWALECGVLTFLSCVKSIPNSCLKKCDEARGRH